MEVCKSNMEEDTDGSALFLIDPQVDFHAGGSLAVPGADADAERISQYIVKRADELSAIYVTLDTHQRYNISHGCFWANAAGDAPPDFTEISLADLKARRWTPRGADETIKQWCFHYLQDLEESQRFKLTIWPEHCIVGTQGHNVVPCIAAALAMWERRSFKSVHYVQKGTNSLTEMYSALKAEVPRPDDKSTQLNAQLVRKLARHNRVVVAGQALSHCVNFTVRDLAQEWPAARLAEIVLLKDAMSPIKGFEGPAADFFKDMKKQGLSMDTTNIKVAEKRPRSCCVM